MLGTLCRRVRPALKQAQLLRGVLPWRHGMRVRACAARSATFHLLDDCLGEFNDILTHFLLRIREANLTV